MSNDNTALKRPISDAICILLCLLKLQFVNIKYHVLK